MSSKCYKERSLMGKPVVGKPVTESSNLDDVFSGSLPAFGGVQLRRVYEVLKKVVEKQIPLVIACAGPVTVSDQHRAWLIPLIKTAKTAYLTVTDAICYHDGHNCLRHGEKHPVHEVNLFGDDAEFRKNNIIRVTDSGFHEQVLFDQDAVITEILSRPEFQKRMTTTERNYFLGRCYAEREQALEVTPGLLSTCAEMQLPVFIGAPADGSIFLNSMKLWMLARFGRGGAGYAFDYDLHEDVFEACAYHYWGLFGSEPKSLAILILGGGVPKNYSLQPEPALSQIFFLENIKGYDFDVQIVSAPVTDGSLSSCWPAEAVSWGKINPETYQAQTASLQGDYSSYMPFIVRALTELLPKQAKPLRLYARREELKKKLFEKVLNDSQVMLKIAKTLMLPKELSIS